MASNKNDNYQPGLDDLIPLSKAAEISGLSSDHLRRLAEQGQIWAKKLGRNWVTTAKAVKGYLAQNRRPGPKKRH
jgi:hypothetical protein